MNCETATAETLVSRAGVGQCSSLTADPIVSSGRGEAGSTGGVCAASLTPRQMDVLRFIQGYQDANGYSPSYRKIMAGCGIKSTGLTDFFLGQLETKRFINRLKKRKCAIEILRRVSVPSINGCPLYFVQNVGDRLSDSDGAPVSLSFHNGDL